MKSHATIFSHPALPIDHQALEQIRDAASIDEEAIVIATPDIHTGYGIPIGSIFASPHFVSPAAVGYDINCGMRLIKTPFHVKELSAATIAREIRKELPLGEGKKNTNLTLKTAELGAVLERGVTGLLDVARKNKQLRSILSPDEIAADLRRIEDSGTLTGDLSAVSSRAIERGLHQLGTLGGGNHFVEVQRVEQISNERVARGFGLETGQIVVMIHSGSRGLGHEIAGTEMRSAARLAGELGLNPPNKQLAYVPAESSAGRHFLGAMAAAANYAFANRQAITSIVRRALTRVAGRPIPCSLLYDVSHNIAKLEKHDGTSYYVHRKGATRARPAALMHGTDFGDVGQPVLIPGSMGTASYVLVGTTTASATLYSVNHGAGRVMSRSAAAGRTNRKGKRSQTGLIDEKRFRESMVGVHLECENRRAIKEEAPDAYKNIDLVIEAVVGAGLAEIVARLTPLAVLKG